MQELVHRWSDLPVDRPLPRLDRRRVVADRVMISHIVLHHGCVVPTHSHENEQLSCVQSGRVRFGLGAEDSSDHRTVVVGAGEVIVLPSGMPHSAEALEESVVLDVFSPPSETTGIDRADT